MFLAWIDGEVQSLSEVRAHSASRAAAEYVRHLAPPAEPRELFVCVATPNHIRGYWVTVSAIITHSQMREVKGSSMATNVTCSRESGPYEMALLIKLWWEKHRAEDRLTLNEALAAIGLRIDDTKRKD